MTDEQMTAPQVSVLVVDDTPDNLRLLSRMLSKRGYNVRPVPSGKLALTSAQAEPPDLILLDIMMPEMDGYEVCERLKDDENTRDIPVIFLSALSEVQDKVKAFAVGGVDYITKPFQAKEVLARVETHLALRELQKGLEEKNAQLRQEIAARQKAEQGLREYQRQLEASYEREQKRRQLSDTLREVAKIVSSTLEQETVLSLILDQLEKVVTYHRATVLILNDDGDELEVVGGRDKSGQEIKRDRVDAYRYALNAAALTEKQPILLPDVTQDERWQPDGTMTVIRSFINAPLLAQDRPVGLLALGRSDDTPYNEDDAQTVFAFASQVAVALENARLYEYEMKEIAREMEIARQIQVSLLPLDAPKLLGLDIADISQPARQVGGDFYNYFVFSGDKLGLAVGDVSGKGMQAALMMALAFGLLTNEVRRELAPAVFLSRLNEKLWPYTQRNKMNTALAYMVLEPPENEDAGWWDLQVANAGVVSPLIRYNDGTVEWLNIGGLPLGTMQDAQYVGVRHPLSPGDMVILSSDGVVEAMNEEGELYGFERLTECVANAPRRGAWDILEWVLNDARDFVGDAEMHDDLTLIVVLVRDNR